MYDAPKEAKLLAYKSRPILEYADVMRDPSARSKIHDIELVQNSAVRFIISNLKGRTDGVPEAKKSVAAPVSGRKEKEPSKINTAHYLQPMMRLLISQIYKLKIRCNFQTWEC